MKFTPRIARLNSLPFSFAALGLACLIQPFAVAHADENLFGYVKGAETLPKGAREMYQWATIRSDKGQGKYRAIDWKTEFEQGVTDRFTASAALGFMTLNTSGLMIDAYLPGDKKISLKPANIELGAKYNFLSPAADDFGLSSQVELHYGLLDNHSGQDKKTVALEGNLIGQKYLMDARMVWVGNLGLEGTYARRSDVANLPAGFEWPTEPEMELEVTLGTGLTYRVAPNWYVGGELQYQTEFETEVGQERWSVFGGPTVHYGAKDWWLTATWFPQWQGGGFETIPGQTDDNLHLIEKTKQEFRLKLGYNF